MLVDSHCHLNFDSFDEDRIEVLDRARLSGVSRIVNPGIDAATSLEAVRLAGTYPQVYAAVGVHPNEASTWDDRSEAAIRDLASKPGVVAIGEIGLDYYWDRAPEPLQKEIFRRQLRLAGELNLPVIIHNREATDDILAILGEWVEDLAASNPDLAEHPGVLHSFSAGLTEAEQAIDLGFFIGITGPVTFKKAQVLQTVVESVPIERLVVETDAPFLTPHPHRGKRNEPAYVRFVAEKIGELRNLPAAVVAEVTTHNAERLFNWRTTT